MGSRGGFGRHSGPGALGRDPMLRSFREFGTQYEAIRYHLENNWSRSKWDSLTSAERRGIVNYTDHWFGKINTALREQFRPDERIQQMIDGATAGLSKWSAAEDVITFRGANMHWTANLLEGTEEQMSNTAFLRSRIGKTFTDRGFMSSGTHMDSKWSSDVTYKIYVHKGVSGMYVDEISANRGEYEFLFNRDTQFKVHSIKTNSNGTIDYMVLEAIPNKKH